MLEEFSFKFLGQEFDHGRHPEPKMPVYLWFLHAENDEELLTASSEPMDESVRHSGCVGDGASAGEQTWLDSSTNAKKRKMSSAQAASDLGDATVDKVVTAMTGMIGGSKTPGDPVIEGLAHAEHLQEQSRRHGAAPQIKLNPLPSKRDGILAGAPSRQRCLHHCRVHHREHKRQHARGQTPALDHGTVLGQLAGIKLLQRR